MIIEKIDNETFVIKVDKEELSFFKERIECQPEDLYECCGNCSLKDRCQIPTQKYNVCYMTKRKIEEVLNEHQKEQ